ncbi:zinc finger matrin-type protein 5 [Chelonus insularis]|uniref:zinc finger matrin-type protein 5 n=1 Tax=Chelonus insularis TaxID=460826 RepID=UPI00158AF982|nr:zinc finger matrin-type protein 5 [Chelonus insularis]
MGRSYYCDYCDRSFKDNYEARKKHLCSTQHVNNRLEHYRYFKDPEEILKEETEKIPCKKLMSGGECAFGNNCRFSHYTPPMIYELQRICAWKKYSQSTMQMTKEPNTDEIIHEYFQNPIISSNNQIFKNPLWSSPGELQNLNLPPSLQPLTPKSITDSNFPDWG